jgi:hypothetical protein
MFYRHFPHQIIIQTASNFHKPSGLMLLAAGKSNLSKEIKLMMSGYRSPTSAYLKILHHSPLILLAYRKLYPKKSYKPFFESGKS